MDKNIKVLHQAHNNLIILYRYEEISPASLPQRTSILTERVGGNGGHQCKPPTDDQLNYWQTLKFLGFNVYGGDSLDSIQIVMYDDELKKEIDEQKVGGNTGTLTKFRLATQEGEQLKTINIWVSGYIQGIQFITTYERNVMVGRQIGTKSSVTDMEFIYALDGRAGALVDALQFYVMRHQK